MDRKAGTRLGCVLAGGASRRFGSDKALAMLDGETLLERAVAALRPWCGQVVIAGRAEGPAPCVPDRPAPGMGPLAGLAGALAHARGGGFDAVLSVGVDTLDLPGALPELLGPAPAYLAPQPVVGLWPAEALSVIDEILAGEGRHSLLAFAHACGARPVAPPRAPANINTPQDLARFARR